MYAGTAAHPVLHAVLGRAASVLGTPRNQSEVLGMPGRGGDSPDRGRGLTPGDAVRHQSQDPVARPLHPQPGQREHSP